ncbi:hypothetical protein pb186bvf_016681 [Paramecium bursaria]
MYYILSLFYCIFYAISSFGFSIAVKMFTQAYGFKLTSILILYELIINIFISIIFGKRKHTSRDTLIYSFVYALQIYTGIKGLQTINIPMYMTLRRTLILFVFLFQKKGTLSQLFAVLFITLRSNHSRYLKNNKIKIGADHLEENYYAIGLIFSNNIFNAISLHLSKKLNEDNNLSPLELLFQNSCNQLPFVFIGSYLTNEWHEFIEMDIDQDFIIYFTLVCLIGFILNISTNMCNMYNSPLAIAITHNIKDIFTTTCSIILFQDFKYDFQILLGISISYIGSLLYSIQKVTEIQKEIKNQQPFFSDEEKQQLLV